MCIRTNIVKRLSTFVVFALTIVFSHLAHSSPNTITFQSRIVKPDGLPLEGSAVTFRMSITDTVGSCVIYQEDFANRNMSDSKGLINLSLGSGAKVFPVGPMVMTEVFNNYGSPTLNCLAGGSINAGSTDRRKLVVQFNDGSGWQTVPAMDINSNPFALQAVSAHKLGNYDAGDYLRTATLPDCTGQALTYNGVAIGCVGVGGGAPAYSSITGATGINAIDNTNFAQTWNWSTATTQNAMNISGNALTTGSLLNLTTSSATLNSTNGLLNVANTSASTTGVVARIQSNNTAGAGLTVLANGNIGIGTTNPTATLSVASVSGAAAPTQSFAVSGGNGSAGNTGAGISLAAGYGDANVGATGASLSLNGGGFSGGAVTLRAGNSGGSGGQALTIGGANGGNTGDQTGGPVNINGGHATGAYNGGVVNIVGGNAGTNGNGANVLLDGGALAGAGTNGNIILGSVRGNVGIGTNLPNRILEVAGPVRISPTVLPGAPAAGDIAVDSGDGNKLKVHNGTSWLTATSTANGTLNKIPKYTAANTLGDSAITDDGSRITATRSIAAVTNTVAAATVNLNLSNTHTLNTVGGAAITIQNPTNGGVYNIVVTDTTSRTYTFTGCTASYYRPANAPTTVATRTIYGLMTVDNGAGGWDCYITWSSGFQ